MNKLSIVGGTYKEYSIEPPHDEIYGSGLRAVQLILESSTAKVSYKTVGNKTVQNLLENYKNVYPNISYEIIETNHLVEFKYGFLLENPDIHPPVDSFKTKPTINLSEDNYIIFGMLDAEVSGKANKVVYDPQNTYNPTKFSSKCSAKQVIYIVNRAEAKAISEENNIKSILDFFFDKENVYALIIKDGPFGVELYKDKKLVKTAPVFKTKNVFKIGSGDIFTTTFAYHWFVKELNIETCLYKASLTTAHYCNSASVCNLFNDKEELIPLFINQTVLSNKTIYLAGPIFTLSDLLLIDKIRDVFLNMNINVFSPYHDVGIGNNKEIATEDLEGIEKADIIFAIVDGLDSGTLIELGYAMAKGKKIIGYNKTESNDSLLMLKAGDYTSFEDLTSAIYNTIWSL
ncbi:nucleoside 2-deoxyribosyltransferase [Carboxylicivirga sp. A043]|uniref:PfkB family carbohydrate kinase n=1 Tax=Carboxylicivirga litoralis TaxID=2816963 RepID=UPI0021CB4625|nr:PfkB family carbohydrate kinase [Carboxylicivirga sp. A043]MCU4157454.1 nucleoside 2-deoxyribosyltransferase [Carboxylicivirga sp. A043]